MLWSALAVIAVVAIVWLDAWNEHRLAKRIDRQMDRLMGRDED